jgi:hypothetical protein
MNMTIKLVMAVMRKEAVEYWNTKGVIAILVMQLCVYFGLLISFFYYFNLLNSAMYQKEKFNDLLRLNLFYISLVYPIYFSAHLITMTALNDKKNSLIEILLASPLGVREFILGKSIFLAFIGVGLAGVAFSLSIVVAIISGILSSGLGKVMFMYLLYEAGSFFVLCGIYTVVLFLVHYFENFLYVYTGFMTIGTMLFVMLFMFWGSSMIQYIAIAIACFGVLLLILWVLFAGAIKASALCDQ